MSSLASSSQFSSTSWYTLKSPSSSALQGEGTHAAVGLRGGVRGAPRGDNGCVLTLDAVRALLGVVRVDDAGVVHLVASPVHADPPADEPLRHGRGRRTLARCLLTAAVEKPQQVT
eukprot:1823991-Prymnesium_polylepis.1